MVLADLILLVALNYGIMILKVQLPEEEETVNRKECVGNRKEGESMSDFQSNKDIV